MANEKHPKVRKDDEPDIQGEGDYRSARRYTRDVRGFVASEDVDKLAKEARPRDEREKRQMERAEKAGRERSKGEDVNDAMKVAERPANGQKRRAR